MKICKLFGDQCFKLNMMLAAVSIPSLQAVRVRRQFPSAEVYRLLQQLAITLPTVLPVTRPSLLYRQRELEVGYETGNFHKLLVADWHSGNFGVIFDILHAD